MTQTSDETTYRFEPTATFFYEDLFAPVEQPPTRLDALLTRLSRRSTSAVSSRGRSSSGTAVRR